MENKPIIRSGRIETGLLILFAAVLSLATGLFYRGSRDELRVKRAALRQDLDGSLDLTNKGLLFLLNPHVIPSLIRSGDRRRAEDVVSNFLKEGAELTSVVVASKDLKPFAVVSPQGEFREPRALERYLAEQAAHAPGPAFRPAADGAGESIVIRHRIVEGGKVDGWLFAKVDVDRILGRLRSAHAYPLAVRLSGVVGEQGRPRAVLDAPIRARDVLFDVVERRLGVALLLLLAAALLYLLCLLLVRKMIFPFELLVAKLDAVIKGDRAPIEESRYPAWLRPFIGNINRLIASVIETQERERRTMASQALQETASQVAHDIRSPLAALDSLADTLTQLPEGKRILVRSAIARIKDIANNLSEKDRPGGEDDRATSVQLLSSLIEPLITEKRLQFRAKEGVEIEFRLDAGSYGLFAKVQAADFKRVISNLVNNAVEALGDRGRVLVRVSPEGRERVGVRIRDDGRGIPAELLPRLGRKGETHGKESGAGLGLYHARARAEAWGGTLEILSEPGDGAEVSIFLPRAPAPAWFVSRLELAPDGEVVILDDDASIHEIWKGRLQAPGLSGESVSVRHFSTPREFRLWVRDGGKAAARALFLVDYELAGADETGLDLIRSLGLGARSILVTSRYEEPGIIERCVELGVRMIPKGLAGFVPIAVARPGGAPDYVLIDDDELVRMTWTISARGSGVTLETFATPEAFFARAGGLNRSTPLYIDAHLGAGVRGGDVARKAAEMGFLNVSMATGSGPEDYGHLEFLKGVIDKTPPWLSSLL